MRWGWESVLHAAVSAAYLFERACIQAIIAYLSREHSGLMGPSTQIMKTEATKLFCLTPRDLEGVPCTKVPKANPLWR